MAVDIAFVTVDYNTLDCVQRLTEFFDSLVAPFTFSFTVVDNGSQEDSQQYLRSRPQIKYIQTGENIGYGRAINRGVAATASKYVCVMNTDVTLNQEALVTLWRFLEEHPEAGVCAPRLTYPDGRDQGMIFNDSLLSFYSEWFAKLVAYQSKRKLARATEPLQVPGVLGAFFLIRRSVMPEPTLFDEDFFFYYEDSALAHTLQKRGVAWFILPGRSLVHVGGKSSSVKSVSLFYAGRYLYLKKFYGQRQARQVYFLDRWRMLRKLWWYSLLATLTGSEGIKSKRRQYDVAWNSVRWK